MAITSWLRNNIMPVSAKDHHVSIDGRANGGNEITKRQSLLRVIGFHVINISWKSRGSYGVLTPPVTP